MVVRKFVSGLLLLLMLGLASPPLIAHKAEKTQDLSSETGTGATINKFISGLLLALGLVSPPLSAHEGEKKQVGILLIGETGVGKTTGINGLYNLLKCKNYWQPHDVLIPTRYRNEVIPCNVGPCRHSELGGEAGQSQTSLSAAYHVDAHDHASETEYAVTLIDTPGLGDTRGWKQDKINIASIVEEMQKHPIHAIAIVIPNSANRLTATLAYCINELKKVLPKDSQDNFIFLISHTATVSDDVLAVLKREGLNATHQNSFPFDLSMIYDQHPAVAHTFYGENEEDRNDRIATSQINWNKGIRSAFRLVQYASNLKPYESQKVINLAKTRKNLDAKMDAQIKYLTELRQNKKAIESYQTQIKEALEAIETNKDFTYPVEHRRKKVIQLGHYDDGTPRKHTVCHECGKICHHECRLPVVRDKVTGHPDLNNCHAADPNSPNPNSPLCRYCGHAMETHVHQTFENEEEVTYEIKVIESKKLAKEEAEHLLLTLQGSFLDAEARASEIKDKLLPKAYEEVAKLYHQIKEKALSVTNNKFLAYLDDLEKHVSDTELDLNKRKEKLADIEEARKEYRNIECIMRQADGEQGFDGCIEKQFKEERANKEEL